MTTTPRTTRSSRFSARNIGTAVAGVLFLAVGLTREGGVRASFLIVGVLLVVVGIAVAAMTGSTSARHRAVVAAHPDAIHVWEVWGAAGLGKALAADGVPDPKVRRTQGTALSLVVADDGLQLWRGAGTPQLLVAYRWTDLVGVTMGSGVIANDGPKPAFVLVTARGNSLVLVPAAKDTGSLHAAPGEVSQGIAAELNTHLGSPDPSRPADAN